MYCTYQYTFLFYYIETKAEDGKRKAGKKCKWLVGTHDVANGNDFNDYGNTYHYAYKNISI